jgi:TRAP-type C4-dicarboxylate transport system substrate-binding protein
MRQRGWSKIGVVGALLVAVALIAAPTQAADTKPIALKAVAAWALSSEASNYGFLQFVKAVNEKAKGRLAINVVGGPDVMDASDQFEAVRTGVVFMAHTTPSYYKSVIPEATSWNYSQVSYQEERDRGWTALMTKMHEDKGVTLLGGATQYGTNTIYLRKQIADPKKDFKGLKMRATATHVPVMQALGAAPVDMGAPDVYSSLERGIIDGCAFDFSGSLDFSIPEVAKFCVDPQYFKSPNYVIVNFNAFKQLPADLQKLLRDTSVEVEKSIKSYYDAKNDKIRQTITGKGCKFASFSPADTKWFENTVYTAAWDSVAKSYPVFAAQAVKMVRK